MILTFIRHWRTFWNAQKVVNGYLEHEYDYLDECGVWQSIQLWEKLRWMQYDALRSSDSQRALDTARYTKQWIWTIIDIQVDKRLRERSFGAYEWDTYSNMNTDSGLLWKQHYEYCEECKEIENSESIIKRWLERFGENIEGKWYEKVIIFSHWSFIRSVLSHYLSLTCAQYCTIFVWLENTGMAVIDIHKKRIMKFNA